MNINHKYHALSIPFILFFQYPETAVNLVTKIFINKFTYSYLKGKSP